MNFEDWMMTIKNRIKARSSAPKTIKELAVHFGYNVSWIGAWFSKNARWPNADNLGALIELADLDDSEVDAVWESFLEMKCRSWQTWPMWRPVFEDTLPVLSPRDRRRTLDAMIEGLQEWTVTRG